MLKLNSPISELVGVGETLQASLLKLGISTCEDLLCYLPRRFEDYTQVVNINELVVNNLCCIRGTVSSISTRRSKKGTLIVDAKLTDGTGSINALWFNQRYILKMVSVGQELHLYGQKKLLPTLKNPFVVSKIVTKAERVAVYPTTQSVKQFRFAQLFKQVSPLVSQLQDVLPATIRGELGLPTKTEAVKACQYQKEPGSEAVLSRLLGTEELLILACAIREQRRRLNPVGGKAVALDQAYLLQVASSFAYQLTDSQKKAAWEIISGFKETAPINRLLYGEVGSGKTAVAFMVAACVLKCGYQVAMMAPTVMLANQLSQNAKAFFEPLGFQVERVEKKAPTKSAQVLIGTHGLIYQKEKIPNLGLIVIDEQHRFGVEQRSYFSQAYQGVHSLLMTATPIPRSLAQTIFGYLDISYLTGKPPHQQKITTKIVNQRQETFPEISERLKRGEPGYYICPLIEENESELISSTSDVSQVAQELSRQFPGAKIEIVHGRVKQTERTRIINAFVNGQVDILVSTTVVEVGIDNQRASWIVVDNAELFGLATLHQLRGRVGRGSAQSICLLVSNYSAEKTNQRLTAMTQASTGLELAELDLSQRGPGELLGKDQSGLMNLKFGQSLPMSDIQHIFDTAKTISEAGLNKYPLLETAVSELLKLHE